jgi:hypothetical protein
LVCACGNHSDSRFDTSCCPRPHTRDSSSRHGCDTNAHSNAVISGCSARPRAVRIFNSRGGRWRPRAGVGKSLVEGLPLLRHPVLRHNEERQVYVRGGRVQHGRASGCRKGVHEVKYVGTGSSVRFTRSFARSDLTHSDRAVQNSGRLFSRVTTDGLGGWLYIVEAMQSWQSSAANATRHEIGHIADSAPFDSTPTVIK